MRAAAPDSEFGASSPALESRCGGRTMAAAEFIPCGKPGVTATCGCGHARGQPIRLPAMGVGSTNADAGDRAVIVDVAAEAEAVGAIALRVTLALIAALAL